MSRGHAHPSCRLGCSPSQPPLQRQPRQPHRGRTLPSGLPCPTLQYHLRPRRRWKPQGSFLTTPGAARQSPVSRAPSPARWPNLVSIPVRVSVHSPCPPPHPFCISLAELSDLHPVHHIRLRVLLPAGQVSGRARASGHGSGHRGSPSSGLHRDLSRQQEPSAFLSADSDRNGQTRRPHPAANSLPYSARPQNVVPAGQDWKTAEPADAGAASPPSSLALPPEPPHRFPFGSRPVRPVRSDTWVAF